jgi:hypothetical protein
MFLPIDRAAEIEAQEWPEGLDEEGYGNDSGEQLDAVVEGAPLTVDSTRRESSAGSASRETSSGN